MLVKMFTGFFTPFRFGFGRLKRLSSYWFVVCLLIAIGVLTTEAAMANCERGILLCIAGDRATDMFREKTKVAKEKGKKKFGDGFDLRNYLRYNHALYNFTGRADVAVPVRKWNLREDKPTEAFFWQAGFDRYRRREQIRDSLRFGGVLRMISDAESHNGIFGVWGFLQHDSVAKHTRLGVGMDYNGEFGRAFLQYYAPLTGWQQVGEYRERGISGGSADMRLRFNQRWALRGRLSYWESSSKVDEVKFSSSAQVTYFALPWLEFQGKYSLRGETPQGEFGATIRIPLGRPLRNTWKSRQRDYTRYLYNPPKLKGRINTIEVPPKAV